MFGNRWVSANDAFGLHRMLRRSAVATEETAKA
jgi:hypothetical protein